MNFSSYAFIIGAGAHCPYAFPSAAQLTDNILGLIKGCNAAERSGSLIEPYAETQSECVELCRLIMRLEIYEPSGNLSDEDDKIKVVAKKLNEFLHAFAGAQVPSIDTFLAKRTKSTDRKDETLVLIGKLIIAYFIKQREDEMPVGAGKRDWIQFLLNTVLMDPILFKDFFDSPPLILTFNNDTLLEKSIESHLIHQHNMTPEEASGKVRGLQIEHIYGDVNTFENKDPGKYYADAIGRIRVIGEERAKEDSSQTYIPKLRNRTKIYFLGFGFDDLNVKYLFGNHNREYIDRALQGVEFVATHKDLSVNRRNELMHRLSFHLDLSHEPTRDCMKLFADDHPLVRSYEDVHEIYKVESGSDPFTDENMAFDSYED